MKFIILIFSIIFAFVPCQKNSISADQNKKIIQRTQNQSFMLESVFYDIGKRAEAIWLNYYMYEEGDFEDFYADPDNNILVIRKGGVKNIEIGVSKNNYILYTLGNPDEIENIGKFIYKRCNDKNEYAILFYFSKDGILTNIVYNIYDICE